jgi:hypothetical protein
LRRRRSTISLWNTRKNNSGAQPVPERQKKKDGEFKASLGYIVRLSQKTTKEK